MIQKRYTQDNGGAYVRHLVGIYDLLKRKNVPNVDQLEQYFIDDADRGSVVYLGPKGINNVPRRANEVAEAVICILEALVVGCPSTPTSEIHKIDEL
jgi:hypothetical protein